MSYHHFKSHPVSVLQGVISVPGDKSISHRSIILGAIAKGITTVNGFLNGADCLATLNAFQSMGVVIWQPNPSQVIIHGVGKYGLSKPSQMIDCGNSGTSIRLLAGLLAAQTFDSELSGDASLVTRPMARISRPLVEMGANITTCDNKPPLIIRGGASLRGIRWEMEQASAQVKSCILLAGLYAAGKTTVIESKPTRNHTEKMLAAFSCPVTKEANEISIDASKECIATTINVPGDISSAAFFIVAATIIPNANLLIKQVGINPTRTGIIDILKKMGANIQFENQGFYGEEPVADLRVSYAPLSGIDIPPEWVPLAIDEFPIILIAAATAHGLTRLRGASELRSKESDRIAAMVDGLNQLGIDAKALDDGVDIIGGVLQGGVINSHHDHRIAMAFAIAGSVAKSAVTIKDCKNVATSFPTFIEVAHSLQLAIEEIYNDD